MDKTSYWASTLRRRIGRRRLLAVTGAGAIGVALSAACGGDEDSTSDVQRVTMAIGAPILGEHARITDITVPDTWVVGPSHEYLLGVSLEGEVNVPQLAESWNIDPDGTSIYFKLRRGVPFHNGKGELKAEDVVYSWQLLTAPDSKEFRAERFRTSVSRIDVLNDYELVFRLAKPDAAFLYSVGETDYGFRIVSKADAETRTRWSFDDPIVAGTGPFVLKQWKQAESVQFERVPYKHYRKTPDYPEFVYKFYPEPSTRLAALLAKEVQIAVLPTDLQREAEAQGLKRIREKGKAGVGLALTLRGTYLNKKFTSGDPDPIPGSQQYRYPDTPLLDDRVRKAMSKAINRDELNKSYWEGEATPMHNYGFLQSRPGWNPDWVKRFPEEYGYDPQAARQLLSAAGYSASRPLTHTMLNAGGYGIFPELADVLESINQYFRAVGIQANLETVDRGTWRGRANKLEYENHSQLSALSVNQFVALTAAGGVASAYVGSRGFNEFAEPIAFVHEQADGLRWTLESKQAEPKWRQLGDMQFNLHAPIPLFWLPSYATVDPKIVKDYQFSGALSGTYTNTEYIKTT